VGEGLIRLDIAVEGEEGRPHRVLQAAVGHDHIENGLRRDRLPHADGFEQAPRRGYDGGCAGITADAAQRRVGDGDGERGAEALTQRNRQRQTGKARTADQHIDRLPIA
jgi:hypothetical protein